MISAVYSFGENVLVRGELQTGAKKKKNQILKMPSYMIWGPEYAFNKYSHIKICMLNIAGKAFLGTWACNGMNTAMGDKANICI